MIEEGHTITLICIPSHVGIQGNVAADEMAKNAQTSPKTVIPLTPEDAHRVTHKYLLERTSSDMHEVCDCGIDSKHILLKCVKFYRQRQIYTYQAP